MKRLVVSWLAGWCLVGCGPSIPEVTPEMAELMDVSRVRLERGRALYVEHCDRCHSRVPPGRLDAEYWRGIVPHMAEHARLDSAEEEDVLVYLMAAHDEVHGVRLPE